MMYLHHGHGVAFDHYDRYFHDIDKDAITYLPGWLRTGQMVERVEMLAGVTKRFNHGLNRAPQGWILTRVEASSPPSIYEERSETTSSALALQCDVDATVSVWVF